MVWSWEFADLSLAVRFLRALRGWNQTELARAAGWDKSRISLMESGKSKVEKADLQWLSKAIGLPFSLLTASLPLLRLLRLALGRDDLPEEMGDRVAGEAEAVASRVAAAARITMTKALLELEQGGHAEPATGAVSKSCGQEPSSYASDLRECDP